MKQKLPGLTEQAWISLLWAQYNKLSEPLKKWFIDMIKNMAGETEIQKRHSISSFSADTQCGGGGE